MKVRVIILAQGTQQRFTGLEIPKQLLELGPEQPAKLVPFTIIDRTLFQLYLMPWGELHVTVVCDGVLREHIERQTPNGKFSTTPFLRNLPMICDTHTLPDPGNSSLKGLYRFLRDDAASMDAHATVVLLGDVCYSWAALRALWQAPCSLAFACSPDLSPSGGELYGIVTNSQAQLFAAVGVAMENHPPKQVDKTYQPGQLRLVLWAIDRAHQWRPSVSIAFDHVSALRAERPWFIPIADYTRDFDKPADLEFLAPTARAAREDDARSGFTW